MTKSDFIFTLKKNSKNIAVSAFIIWILFQIIAIILHYGDTQYCDAGVYQSLALECYESHSWYPTPNQLSNNSYLFNPGYVNWLILHLHVFQSLNVVPITNLLLNIILLISGAKIVKKISNRYVSHCFVVLFCFTYSNILVVTVTMSELLFTTLIYFSIFIIRKNYLNLIIAGILLALANYVRPLIVIFIIPILIYMYFRGFNIKYYITYIFSLFISLLLIAMLNHAFTGYYITSSTTAGVNLMMVAHDEANGGYCTTIFEENKPGYIDPRDSLNVFEKDKYWKTKAIAWIKENPLEFIKNAPLSLGRLWVGDDYNQNELGHPRNWYNPIKRLSELILYSFVYFLELILFFCYLLKSRKKIFSFNNLFLLPLLFCCMIHLILPGTMRYHYSCMPIIIYYASLYLYNKISSVPLKSERIKKDPHQKSFSA